jgi:Proton-conducting membrane transporter/NADH-ubiquinone oxidoreductase chain 4, amino terminus
MTSWPILSVVTFLPIVGAIFIALLNDDESGERNARWIALWTTLITFVVSLILVWRFDPGSADFQFLEKRPWLGGAITYSMGVDGISLPFVILTTALMPIAILASWTSVQTRVRSYMICFLVLEILMVGTFCALDLVLFYLFFEGGLIPMFLIIGVWGGPRRVYASFKFFLYTLLGSVLMLLAIMAMYWQAGTTDIPTLLHHAFPRALQTWAWFAFLASFAVKMPMWPVHTWLPDAHVEAPTAGSVILAAILLKLGGYGFLRFSLPMFPQASVDFAPLIYALSVVAIIYTSLVALMQEDVKKLIAYSSVAHMGFVTMGLFNDRAGRRRRHFPDDLAWHRLRRAVPLCRRYLRPHAYPRDRRLWRTGQPHADLRLCVHDLHARQCGAARDLGLHRRVPDAARHLPRQQLGGDAGDARDHPLRGLRAVALPQGDLRQAREAVAIQHQGCRLARNGDPGAACDPDHRVRRLSEAGARHVGDLGDAAHRQFPPRGE